MKQIILLLCTALLLTGCSEKPAMTTVPIETVTVTEAEAVYETGPERILSQEMAMLEGYVVMQDGDVRHNAGSWMAFRDCCSAGESCAVTVVQFHTAADYVRYDVSFDGSDYTVTFEKDDQQLTETAQMIFVERGTYDKTMEPYDCYEAYLLNDIVLYQDQIAEPDYEGVTEIFLHAKEGDPPIKSYTDVESVDPILQLLMDAQWIAFDSEEYVYGMKLLMTNRDGKELVIELDLNRGVYRYGMQSYVYGEISDLFAALGIEQWPDSVLEEFSAFIK